MNAWTYSMLESFETCPKKFFHLRVARDVKEPQGEHAVWGERVHTAFENKFTADTPLPEGMTQWQGIADKFAALPGEKLVEYKLSLTQDFEPTEWKTAWARGIADLVVVSGKTALVADWKTGKKKPTEQLALYAALAGAHFPQVTTFKTAFVWLKTKEITKSQYARDELPYIWQSFLPRVKKLQVAYDTNTWPARPSGLCRQWCHVLSCQYNGKRK